MDIINEDHLLYESGFIRLEKNTPISRTQEREEDYEGTTLINSFLFIE